MSAALGAFARFLLPEKLTGRFIYRLARTEIGWLKNLLIVGFRRLYRIDLSDAEVAEPTAYPNLNSFFTRSLVSGARPVAADPRAVVSPADGTLTEFGRIDDDRLIQAKGHGYSLEALLAETGAPFRDGHYATIYLAPPDYHRVHTPVAGRIERARYVPGRRFAVNRHTVTRVDGVFCRNERVVLWLATDFGPAAVVMVGAFNVASLSTVVSGEIESGRPQLIEPATPIDVARGGELGRFNLGSTVIVVFPPRAVRWRQTLEPGHKLRMGQSIGELEDRAADPPAGAARDG